MVQIVIVEPSGTAVPLDAKPGQSLMQAALRANVKGIAADCGGNCACATCHVVVDDAWLDRVPPARPDELDMLADVAAERLPGSRLACQIEVAEPLEGLVVRVAPRQY